MDSSLHAHGDDQPEPRAAQPDADPRAGRRPYLHPRARRAGSPRLQHACEGKDAAGRLRPPPDAHGHGDLQRPDENSVDRKTGALALILLGAALLTPALRSAEARGPQTDTAGTGTFSILGYDPDTGELGAAVQSRVYSVGNGVLWAEAAPAIAGTEPIV